MSGSGVHVAGSGSTIERPKDGDPGTRLTGAPDYSRTSLGKGIDFHEYVSSGVVEVPEVGNQILSLILRTGSPSLFEWRGNGGEHVAELPAGSISLFPEGMRQPVRVTRPLPGKVSILEIDSRFFARSIGQIARGGRLELVKLLRLDDRQVCRLMETLRADVGAGSPGGPLFGESIATALLAHIAQRYAASTTKLEGVSRGVVAITPELGA
jgi:hypothetical protein